MRSRGSILRSGDGALSIYRAIRRLCSATPNEPFARLGRIDQRIEEHPTIPLGEAEAVMLSNSVVGSADACERSKRSTPCSRERGVYCEIDRREVYLRPLPHYREGGFEMARVTRCVEQGRRIMIAEKLRSYRGES